MNDALKMFLIALVTAIASQLLLGPYILRLQGLLPMGDQATVAAKVEKGTGEKADGTSELAAPNLEGMSIEEARDRWRDKGIVIIEDGERDGSGVAPGTILQQRPAAGAPLSTKEIRVVVAAKSEELAVPEVIGKTAEQARGVLEHSGFDMADPTPEASDKPAGTVIKQTPDPGAKAKKGSIVRVVIAEPAAIAVPKVTGVGISKAKQLLTEAGLKVGAVRRVEDAERSGGTVLRQTPAAGEKVPPGTEVELVAVAPD